MTDPVNDKHNENKKKLKDLLLKACPPDEKGRVSLNHLSRLLGVTKQGVRFWINEARLPPARAVDIVRLSDGRVTLADVQVFVFGVGATEDTIAEPKTRA